MDKVYAYTLSICSVQSTEIAFSISKVYMYVHVAMPLYMYIELYTVHTTH